MLQHPRKACPPGRSREVTATGMLMYKFSESWASTPTPARFSQLWLNFTWETWLCSCPALCPASHFPPWGPATAAHTPLTCLKQCWHQNQANKFPNELAHLEALVQSLLHVPQLYVHYCPICNTATWRHASWPVRNPTVFWQNRLRCALAMSALGIGYKWLYLQFLNSCSNDT